MERLAHALEHAQERARNPSFIYLVKCHDFVKIGIADDVQRRLTCLQTGCPYILKLIASRRSFDAKAEESALHKQYESQRINGEWFRMPKPLLKKLIDSFRP